VLKQGNTYAGGSSICVFVYLCICVFVLHSS